MRDKWVAQPPAALSLGTCPQPGWPLGDAGLGARPLGLSGWGRQDGQQEVLSAVRAGRAQQEEEEGWRGLVCSAVLSPWHSNLRSCLPCGLQGLLAHRVVVVVGGWSSSCV